VLVDEPVVRASVAELAAIAAWTLPRRLKSGFRLALIGGWAVHAYNPWFGSRDIDFASGSAVRKSLLSWLRKERGYRPRRFEGVGVEAVEKQVPGGSLIVEFIRESAQFPFEGLTASYPLRTLFAHVRYRRVEGIELPVPRPETLFVLKAKAAWDRSYRVKNGTSADPAYERSKFAKDAGDLLALMDSSHAPTMDLEVLGEELDPFPFLLEMLAQEELAAAGATRYQIPVQESRDRFRSLLTLL